MMGRWEWTVKFVIVNSRDSSGPIDDAVYANGHSQIPLTAANAFVLRQLNGHACACTHKPIHFPGHYQGPQIIGESHNIASQARHTPLTVILSPSPTRRNGSERNEFRYRLS